MGLCRLALRDRPLLSGRFFFVLVRPEAVVLARHLPLITRHCSWRRCPSVNEYSGMSAAQPTRR
jgi:hypothetical protein